MRRIYLDNAATSWPKPPAVYEAVDRYGRENGAAVGRAATRTAQTLQRTVDHCRRQMARLLGAASPESIIFGFNGTDVLNMVFHGWVREGDHVVTSAAEHNSILRPLRLLTQRMGVRVDSLPVDHHGRIDISTADSVIRDDTRLVAITSASNVTGALQPLRELTEMTSRKQVPFLLDAAQSAGHVPLSVSNWPIDFLATSGHKGLLGPLGTGVLYVRPGLDTELLPLRQGGTGSASESEEIAESGPERFEAGNHNAPGLVGLAAAIDWIQEQGVASLLEHEMELTAQLLDGLASMSGVTIFGPLEPEARVGTVSIRLESLDPQTTAAVLESEFGIETRAGLHCAPRMHAALGTLAGGGTVRLSLGPMTTREEIDSAIEAIRTLAGA
jgi:cysteine desulfurase / selenocysteine lyase